MKGRDTFGNCVYIGDVDVCLGQLTEEHFHTELHVSLTTRSFLLRRGSMNPI